MLRPQIFDYEGVRACAKARLPWMVFDYIDGAAGQGTGVDRNRAALDAFVLEPRVLVDVSERDVGVDVFGQRSDLPFGISPMGMCNLSHPKADLAFAKLGAETGAPVGVSTVGSTDLESMWEWSEGTAWFQLYFSGDGSGTLDLAKRAKDAGYETLVLTLDVPEVGFRPRELRRGFKMPFRMGVSQFTDFALHPRWSLRTLAAGAPRMATFDKPGYTFDRTASRGRADWAFFDRLRQIWPGKLVTKGVTHVGDAKRLLEAGADAIQVSSHGARQLESAPAPFTALQAMRRELGPDVTLFYDSGLNSGEDIVKAHAAGANFVFLGRYMQFAAAAGGPKAVKAATDLLCHQVSLTLAQLGCCSLSEVINKSAVPARA